MWLASVEDGPIQKKREKFLVLGCPASSLGKDQEVKDQGQTYLPPPGPVEPARPPLGGTATTGSGGLPEPGVPALPPAHSSMWVLPGRPQA